MAKHIIFVRHGKSSWELEVNDKDRPLKERGIKDAHLVAQEMKSLGLDIDAVFSSPANRALHTCMIIMRRLELDLGLVKVTSRVYDFSGAELFDFLKSLPDTLTTVMVFGHNYAFTNLVNQLGNKYIENVPTSGMVKIDFEIEHWKDLADGHTRKTIFPKQLK
ncbi:MAG: histidine phosphatase family protein [Flavobacteriaceae bacterium]|nr:histidine phosphatase family protein [Flavobacteriaceae bacterium]